MRSSQYRFFKILFSILISFISESLISNSKKLQSLKKELEKFMLKALIESKLQFIKHVFLKLLSPISHFKKFTFVNLEFSKLDHFKIHSKKS